MMRRLDAAQDAVMTDRVLVAFSSKHGATREIADAIAEQLRVDGLSVDAKPVEDVVDIDPYAAVIVGSAVYMGRWRRDAVRFLKHHGTALGERPLWLFTSGPLDTSDVGDHTPRNVRRLAERIGAREHATFYGRLPEEPSGFAARAMVSATPADERDARDWTAIRSWADAIAPELSGEPATLAIGSDER